MNVGEFYKLMMKQKEPFFLSFECPECSGELQAETVCDHGELYTCKTCTFKSYVDFQGNNGTCIKCSMDFSQKTTG